MDNPRTIFKYEPFALRAIQNLKASSVYFAAPSSFNDPYDCSLAASIADTPDDQLELLRRECLASSTYPEEVRRTIPSLTIKEFESRIRKGAQVFLDQAREDYLGKMGVTCFSETNDNLLLWSHYGGRYKGYCLEFSTEYEPFNKLQRVKYVKEMPKFLLSDFIRNENHRKLLDMFCTKSSDWAYEKEWRALHGNAGTLFAYKREALRAIYFGPDIESQDRDLLCNIVYCQFPDAELWIGKRSTATFRVEFEKVEGYLPYADARRKGLTS